MQSEILIRDLIYFISIISNLTLGLFVFLKGKKEKINRTFFLAVIWANLWLISLFLFYIIESPQVVLWLGRINFAVILPMLYYLLRFALIFPREIIPLSRKIKNGLGIWIFLFTVLIIFTPFVSKEEIITGPGQRETVYGPLFSLYVLHYIVFSVTILTILFYKLRRLKEDIEKNQVKYILIGLSLALAFGFTTNILLYSLGLYSVANFGPLAPLFFFGFVTVAILRHYLFNIKVISAEFFTVFFALFLFISIFTAQTFVQRILNAVVFIGAAIFGIFLIKSVIQEIKHREEAQKLTIELQKTYEELKVLDKAKSEFISMASHQLRTPLSATKGYISMIIEGSYGPLSEKIKEKMENVFQSNERLIKIINDLLNISKIELGKMETEIKPTKIEELIQSCYEEMKMEIEKKKLKFIFEKPKISLPKINIDPLKIRQVILNLIDNAIHYTPKGEIEIKAEKINSSIQISVRDTGEGLTEEERRTIFEGFTRGSAGITHFIEGAGLGLYIAKKYIELHRGKIRVESEGKGRGSTFYVELPIR
jgi:signal transduction histidine kinase